jgi:hypothetical protein
MESGLEQLLPTSERLPAEQLQWTALGRDTRIILSEQTFPSWKEALADLGQRFQEFRSYDRRRGGQTASPGPDYHSTKALLDPLPVPPVLPVLPERAGFGLPYAQGYRSLKKANDKKPPTVTFLPLWQGSQKEIEGRRASPLLCKVGRLADNGYFWQVAYLPSQFLPDKAWIRIEKMSGKGKETLTAHLNPPGPFGVPRPGTDQTLVKEFLDWLEGGNPQPGNLVVAELLSEKTKKGGWRARHPGTGLSGPIQNSEKMPKDKEAGNRVRLRVKSVTQREIAFEWPDEGKT